MKTVIIQGDGLAGSPASDSAGATPLKVGATPSLDYLASHGEVGRLKLPGDPFPLTGAATTLALLGYDPRKYVSGLGAFAGSGLDVLLGKQDVAFLCNLVTFKEGGEGKKLHVQTMKDDMGGGITTEEARELIDALNEQLASETIQFYAGDRHRHLMVWVNGPAKVSCHDPHAVVGQEVGPFLPSGERADMVKSLMEAARVILHNHPVNLEREDAGKQPANGLWLWGPGKPVDLVKLTERWKISGAMVSSCDYHRGMGVCAGLQAVHPYKDAMAPGDLSRYAEAALQLLSTRDFVYLHIPEDAPVRALPFQDKVSRVEQFDEQVMCPLLKALPAFHPYRVLVVCTHWVVPRDSPENHVAPFTYYDSARENESGGAPSFHETAQLGEAKDPVRFLERVFLKS